MNAIMSWCMECALLATIVLGILLYMAIKALDKEVR